MCVSPVKPKWLPYISILHIKSLTYKVPISDKSPYMYLCANLSNHSWTYFHTSRIWVSKILPTSLLYLLSILNIHQCVQTSFPVLFITLFQFRLQKLSRSNYPYNQYKSLHAERINLKIHVWRGNSSICWEKSLKPRIYTTS